MTDVLGPILDGVQSQGTSIAQFDGESVPGGASVAEIRRSINDPTNMGGPLAAPGTPLYVGSNPPETPSYEFIFGSLVAIEWAPDPGRAQSATPAPPENLTGIRQEGETQQGVTLPIGAVVDPQGPTPTFQGYYPQTSSLIPNEPPQMPPGPGTVQQT